MGLYVPPKAEQNAAIASLQTTGHLPNDKYWNMVVARHDLNPVRFDHYHPLLAFIADRNEGQEKGTLGCNASLVSDKLLKDYQKNHTKFERTHTGWITKLVKAEIHLSQHPVDCEDTKPVCVIPPQPMTVPEPYGFTLLTSGLLIGAISIGIVQRIKGRRYVRRIN